MLRLYFSFVIDVALHNIATWRIVKREITGLALSWAYCLSAPHVLELGLRDYLPSWLMWLFVDLFWPTLAASIFTMVSASMRSALPAILALALVGPALFIAPVAAAVLLILAVLGIAVHSWAIYAYARRLRRNVSPHIRI